MTFDIDCPYCLEEVSIELEDYEDGVTTQVECPNCKKIINVTPNISVDLDVDKCICQTINHKYKLQHVYPKAFAKWECKYCGITKPLTSSQRKRLHIQTPEEFFNELENECKRL